MIDNVRTSDVLYQDLHVLTMRRCYILIAIVPRLLTASWQVKEDAHYYAQRAIHVSARRKKETVHMRELSQQLQQTQEAMQRMQQEQTAWQERQMAIMREEYARAITAHREEVRQDEPQHGMEDDETEIQMVEQLLQYEKEVEQLRQLNKEQVSGWHA